MPSDPIEARINTESLFFTSAITPAALIDVENRLVPTLERLAAKIAATNHPRIYFIGGGASQSASLGGKYLFNHLTTLPSEAMNGWRLLSEGSPSLNQDAFVVATSYSGQTPEVLESIKLAKQRGATAVAVTNTRETPLAKLCDFVLDYPSKAVYTVPLAINYWLSAFVMKLRGENASTGDQIIAGMKALPGQMSKIYETSRQPSRALAEQFVDAPGFYVLGSGPLYGLCYKLALSVVIENLWIDGCPIETGEFYHGPIEIIPRKGEGNQTLAFLHLVGSDASRRVSETVIQFCQKQSMRQLVFDAADYPEFGELFSPFALFPPTEWFIMYMCALKDHDVDERRYMGKIGAGWGDYGL